LHPICLKLLQLSYFHDVFLFVFIASANIKQFWFKVQSMLGDRAISLFQPGVFETGTVYFDP